MRIADVIVVGAGPAGSVTATLLARWGFRVVLIDRARFPRDKPCGDYCNPGAVRTLETVGCLPDLLSGGATRISGMMVCAQDGSRFEVPFSSGTGLLLPRRRLDLALLTNAAEGGATIVEGLAIHDVGVENDGVRVASDSAGSPRFRARLLIAADGMHSVVARRLGLARPILHGRYTVGAYFAGLPYHAPRGELHLGPGLYCGVAHFGGGVANVCMALPRRWLRRRTMEQAFVTAVPHLPVLADALAGATRESQFRCTGPVGFAAHHVVADRTMLVGDAGGVIEPMTGQGISRALRSAWLAAHTAALALRCNDLSRMGLRTYAERHRREAAPRIRLARWLQPLALRRTLTPMLVRRLSHRPGLASQLLGATGDVLAPSAVLSMRYLIRFAIGADAHGA